MRRTKTIPSSPIEFTTLELSKADILSLPDPHSHFLVNSGLAINDINTFSKLLILYGDAKSQNPTVRRAAVMHFLQITRTMSARVIEFIKLVEDYSKRCRRSSISPRTVEACNAFVKSAKASPSYNQWKNLRDQITHHYVLSNKDIKNNVSRAADGHDFSIVLHESSGNTFFPISEDVAFQGALGEFVTVEEATAEADILMDWCVETGRLAQEFQAECIVELLKQYFPNLGHQTAKVPVEEKFIIREGTRPPGLFFLRGKPPRRH